jgi:hypothetical protein
VSSVEEIVVKCLQRGDDGLVRVSIFVANRLPARCSLRGPKKTEHEVEIRAGGP